MTIRRFSSRRDPLDQSFLLKHLQDARSYRRIAGYFTSSLFEVGGELIERIPEVRIVCNSDIQSDDLRVAQVCEARLLGRWNEFALEADALMNRDRYKRLGAFLEQHANAIRVAPDDICGFVHGKAGIIELADGRKLGFIGSMNESSSGWQRHYEILWEDDSPEGVQWIEEEFEFLWNAARPLPRAVVREVNRRGRRREISFEDIDEPEDVAPAALIESPMYREGMALQPWQRAFVKEVLRHHRNHGSARLLLADEVGLGKTLSLGVAALALCLLENQNGVRRKPAVIFAPATLCEQWQTEMIDKLGIPCARWDTQKKVWLDHQERAISPVGREHIADCPLRIGIISTGLMMRDCAEKTHLLGLRFGLVILDESHKARSQQALGKSSGEPNNLLQFMREIAARSRHVLLGTATPIQTRADDLWDQLGILHQGDGNFVLGNDYAPWHRPKDVLPVLSGQAHIKSASQAWDFLRSPLPQVDSSDEPGARKVYSQIRDDLEVPKDATETGRPVTDLDDLTREVLEDELETRIANATFFQRENPIVRHVVLRKRTDLEDKGLLKRIGVDLHPDRQYVRDTGGFDALFEDRALRVDEGFRYAYEQARTFGKVLSRRGRGGGFMKNLMAQRICSSIRAGSNTARKLLAGEAVADELEEQEVEFKADNHEEIEILQSLITALEQVKVDPKLRAIEHYLEREKWLEHGVIIFSQYYDTAQWVAGELAKTYPDQPIGLYAGAARSRLLQHGDAVSVEREAIKKMVAEHQIRLMVATDAACEGLNLQTLGTLINIDLPWNPTRLEQRIGRIKRFGQVREKVDMLNLVNQDTVDEKVYQRLSERMRDRYDLFGSLPDTIRDDWIEDIETLGERMDEYINAQKDATGFDLRYQQATTATGDDWRDCAEVLSRRDFFELMSKPW